MSVLILEDDPIKGKKIQALLNEEALASDLVGSASECLNKLRSTHYDILVLDLLVPWENHMVELPDYRYSKLILSEIAEGKCRAPKYVIGITQDFQLWKNQESYFNEKGWILVHYDRGIDWKSLLKDRIKHVRNVNQSGHTNDVDIAIITALHDPEATAVLELNEFILVADDSGSGLNYHKGTIGDCTAVLFVAPEMGVAATACLSSYIAERFHPKLLVMCGIAAGISKDLKLGDVVIAHKVWDYASGKVVEDNSLGGKFSRCLFGRSRWSFLPSTNTAELDPHLAQWISSLKATGDNWWIPKGSQDFNMELGPVACGPWVVGNRVVADSLLKRERKLLALEMELYGLYLCPKVASRSQIKVLGIKGISDFANPSKEKDSGARIVAARNSVRVLQQLVAYGLKKHI